MKMNAIKKIKLSRLSFRYNRQSAKERNEDSPLSQFVFFTPTTTLTNKVQTFLQFIQTLTATYRNGTSETVEIITNNPEIRPYIAVSRLL